MLKFNEIPKFLVNLERRPDRLAEVKKELEYIGWEYEIFKAIDTGNHEGITRSTLEIIKIAKEKGYPRVMIIEDDIRFMPYAKDFLNKIEEQCGDLKFGVFNLAPTLDRPISKSVNYDLLLDMTNLPPKLEHQRDIYAANLIIYDESIYDKLFDIEVNPRPYYYPIDEFVFKYIIKDHQSYSPILPIAPQSKGFSNIGNVEYSNFYMQTYNWNAYSPVKIPGQYMDEYSNQKIKENNTHKTFEYVS
jgi:GR25 family glycosyltransferase involved in LPS biosynthesis